MQARQHRQPTAQLSMIHNRNPPPPTPLARRYSDDVDTSAVDTSVLHTDENIASLYTGMRKSSQHRMNPMSLPSQQRQQQQQRYNLDEQEIDPLSSGALQFVPAFAEADWSSILDEEEEKKESDIHHHHHTKSCVSLPGAASGAFRSQKDSRTSAYASRCSRTASKQQQHLSNGRISRIKSMFSSRAAVPTSGNSRTATAPPSPSHSSSGSSGFVGWPGTQDSNGKTVPLMSSSYDENSSAGAAYLAEELKRAEQQISHWTAQTSRNMTDDFDSVGSGFPSPIRPIRSNSSNTSSPTHRNQSGADISFLNHNHDEEEEEEHPQTPAEFHLAAAIADAKAKENARRSMDHDASFGFTESNHSFTENNDALHQPLPLLRTKGRSLPSSATSEARTNSSNRIRHQSNDESKQNGNLKASSSSQFRARANKSLDYDFDDHIYSGPVDLDDIPPEDNDTFDPAHKFTNNRPKNAKTIAKHSRIQPPTEDALHFTEKFGPAHRNFATPTSKGFRGLLDKTKDVPCLMDNMDSDSMSSSKATSVISSGGPSNTGGLRRDDLRGNRSNVIRETMVRGSNSRPAEEDAGTVSDVFDGISVTKESDVFDNLSFFTSTRRNGKTYTPSSYPERIAEEDEGRTSKQDDDGDDFKMVLLGGGLTAIQATKTNFSNRQTPSDYDDALTNSEVSSSGDVKIPGYLEMLTAGKRRDSSLHGIQGNFGTTPKVRNSYDETLHFAAADSHCDSSNSGRSSLFTDPYRDEAGLNFEGDLSEYYVNPSLIKLVVRKYRSLSNKRSAQLSFSELEKEEDEHKAFALFEMRSRIMEKDIERGLERRGGTSVVDDIVTTSYNRTAHRIRDAVIVSKAWRDGATIADVVNSALLTRRAERTFFIKRPIAYKDNYNSSAYSFGQQRFTWEAVKWLDDTDIVQYRCPSLGSRHMRGFEIFTIGDCQSILLKLTNERCMELRQKLNEATAKQISAEELLKEEGDGVDGVMTEAEMYYLSAMEEVKAISKKLVGAEQSFSLVRDRIEKLISKYETILMKLEAESFAGVSSVVTSSSFYSEYETSDFWEQDRERWARRARRAEIRAEIAAREALIAKQEIQKIQEEKIREVDALKRQLLELQSESSVVTAERERVAIARSLAVRRSNNSSAKSTLSQQSTKLDSVKQRFRDRMAAKKQQSEGYHAPVTPNTRAPLYPQKQKPVLSAKAQAEREILRAAGEEMYQQMDFYERSLKAVDRNSVY